MQRSSLLPALLAILVLSGTAMAADWPDTVNIAGFSIAGVKGTMNADGSGKATGKLKISGGDIPVSLSKTASGAPKASFNQKFNIGKLAIDAACDLDQGGLKGNGSLKLDNMAISGAGFRMDSRGNLSGNGRLDVPNLSMPVNFTVSGNQMSIVGSAPKQVAVDTPVARYMFKGEIQLNASRVPLALNAVGTVERRGKVGKSADTFGPLTSSVNIQNGQAGFNIAGVSINFKMW